MSHHIFTYGSLMFPQVWSRVVRGSYRCVPAVVAGHARFAVRGETYPGMVAASGQSVQGVLYFDVAPQDLARLDAFEEGDYRRAPVCARLDSSETVTVDTYLYLDATRLANAPWDPEAFDMQRFLRAYCNDRLAE